MVKFRLLAVGGLLMAGLFMLPTQPALAARKPAPQKVNLLGIDVSWPQCGKQLPTDQAFAIVGVNGGLATIPNPCLSDQLRWAQGSSGVTTQPKVQLYVNTANPGGLGTPSWPASNIDPLGTAAPNPFGLCDNGDTLACAWQYGWNRAVEDVHQWFVPAAQQVGLDPNPSLYVWWLDVETENTWKLDGTTFANASNTAVLEGMTDYFQSLNAQVGLYSTAYQWNQIVGSGVGPNSNMLGLDNWRPSGSSLRNAKANCSVTPLTSGGKITLTQFVSKGLDYNHSCV